MHELTQNWDSRSRTVLALTLGISLVLHLFSVIVLKWNHAAPSAPVPAPIELVDVPTPEQLAKKVAAAKKPQMAETEKVENDKLDPNARFLSDRNQTVQKQTRAKQTDDFREHQGTGIKSYSRDRGAIPPTASELQKQQQSASELDGIPTSPHAPTGVKRDWKTLSMKDLSMGNGLAMGATDDKLEGVAEGDETVLSTREFQYYSYYHRIKQTLRQYWKPNVERRIAVIWGKGGKLKDGEMVTQLLVLLDDSGKVEKISTVASSGFTDIDDAAVEAFHRASPFPNPPRGIIDRDGLVRIRWDFILKAQSGPAIQFRRPTGGGFAP